MITPYDRYIHEYAPGRWVIAYWVRDACQYQAPMTSSAMRLTGCHTLFARNIEDIGSDPCAYRYNNRASALATARRLFRCYVEDGEGDRL